MVETCFKAPITCWVVDQHRRFNSVSGLYRDVSENMGMPDNFIKKRRVRQLQICHLAHFHIWSCLWKWGRSLKIAIEKKRQIRWWTSGLRVSNFQSTATHTHIAFWDQGRLEKKGPPTVCVRFYALIPPWMVGNSGTQEIFLWVLWAGWVRAPSSKWPTTQVTDWLMSYI